MSPGASEILGIRFKITTMKLYFKVLLLHTQLFIGFYLIGFTGKMNEFQKENVIVI